MSKKIISIVLSLAIMCVFMPTVAMAGTYSASVNNNKIELSEGAFNTLLDMYTGTQSPVKFLAKDLRSAEGKEVPLTVKTLDKKYVFSYTVESAKLSAMKCSLGEAVSFEKVFPLLLSDKVSTSAVKPVQNQAKQYNSYTFAKGYPVLPGYALKAPTTVKVTMDGGVATQVVVDAKVIADKDAAVALAKAVKTTVTTKSVTAKKGKKKVKYVKLTYNAKSGSDKVKQLKNEGFTATYKFYKATKKSGKYSLIGQSTKTAFTYKKAKAKKTYYYKVVVSFKAPDGTVVATTLNNATAVSKKL